MTRAIDATDNSREDIAQASMHGESEARFMREDAKRMEELNRLTRERSCVCGRWIRTETALERGVCAFCWVRRNRKPQRRTREQR